VRAKKNMQEPGLSWKPNWEETKGHLIEWWNGQGLAIGSWGAPQAEAPHEAVTPPPSPGEDPRSGYEDTEWRARSSYAHLARGYFGADILPMAESDIGPGSLALALGSEPGFSRETVWFEPSFQDAPDVNALPPLRFNPDAYWWQVHERQLRRNRELGRGRYLSALPDLVENIDILSALRDPQTLMVDMIENPEWVLRSLREINQAFFEGYTRLYEIAREPDGSSAFGAFRIWGPGKTAKVQCDACAMFSPEMFRDFVKPALAEQCAWLDHAIYHLDGTQCICHLDHLLTIDSLRAIEWTPQAGIEPGTHERWFPLYKRILDAGKSVQIMGGGVGEIEPVLKAIGGKGVYILAWFNNQQEVEQAQRLADKCRYIT